MKLSPLSAIINMTGNLRKPATILSKKNTPADGLPRTLANTLLNILFWPLSITSILTTATPLGLFSTKPRKQIDEVRTMVHREI